MRKVCLGSGHLEVALNLNQIALSQQVRQGQLRGVGRRGWAVLHRMWLGGAV